MSPIPPPLPSEGSDVRPEATLAVGVDRVAANLIDGGSGCADTPGPELPLFNESPAAQLLVERASTLVAEANPAACAFYATTRDGLVGRSIAEIPGFSAVRYADALLRGEVPERVAFSERVAAGEPRDVEVVSVPVAVAGRALVLATIADVSRERRAEEALRRVGEKYRAILEGIEEGYYEVDLEGRFTLCNDALCRILRVGRDVLLGTG